MHLSPAAYAAFVFGGYSAVGKALGVVRRGPYRWSCAHRQHESGLIPVWYLKPLLALARERGLDLTEIDLIHGREVADELLRGRRNAPRLPLLVIPC